VSSAPGNSPGNPTIDAALVSSYNQAGRTQYNPQRFAADMTGVGLLDREK